MKHFRGFAPDLRNAVVAAVAGLTRGLLAASLLGGALTGVAVLEHPEVAHGIWSDPANLLWALLIVPSLVISLLLAGMGAPVDWELTFIVSTGGTFTLEELHPALVVMLLAIPTYASITVGLRIGGSARNGPNPRRRAALAGLLFAAGCGLLVPLASWGVHRDETIGLVLQPAVAPVVGLSVAWGIIGALTGALVQERKASATSNRRPIGLATTAFLGVVSAAALLSGGVTATANDQADVPHSSPSRTLPVTEGLDRLRRSSRGHLDVSRRADGAVSFIAGDLPVPRVASAGSPRSKAKAVLAQHAGAFVGDGKTLPPVRVVGTERGASGHVQVEVQQKHASVPVYGARAIVTLTPDQSRVVGLSNGLRPIPSSLDPSRYTLTAEQATARAEAVWPESEPAGTPERLVYAPTSQPEIGPVVAWLVPRQAPNSPASETFIVEARAGEVIDTLETTFDAIQRRVYDDTGPGNPVLSRGEGAPPVAEADVNQIYDHSGEWYDYVYVNLGRRSYDGWDSPLRGVANASDLSFNAYYRDTDESTHFGPGMTTRDIVAHEWTHGITDHSARLEYYALSGALNESFSDVVAATVDNDDWTIGEGSAAGTLRSMQHPTAYGAPGHTDHLFRGCDDHAGVHTNSGIPNRAWYLIASELGRDQATRMFNIVMEDYLTEESGFDEFESALYLAATNRHGGPDSHEATVVRGALDSVGLTSNWRDPGFSCGCAMKAAFADAEPVDSRIDTYYRAAEELLPVSDGGLLLKAIYETNTDRIASALLADSSLRQQAQQVFTALAPGLNSLMDGEGEQATVAAADIAAVNQLLDGLARADDDSGATSTMDGFIDAGLADLSAGNSIQANPLEDYAGLTYSQAWARVQSRLCDEGLFACPGLPYGKAPPIHGKNFSRPLGDSTPDAEGWAVVGTDSTTIPWPAINEPVEMPDAPDTSDYITASSANSWTRIWISGTAPYPVPSGLPHSNGKLWYYASTGPNGSLQTQLTRHSVPQVSETIGPNAPAAWRSVPYNLDGDIFPSQVWFTANPGTELVRPNEDRVMEWGGDDDYRAWVLLRDRLTQPTTPPTGHLIDSSAVGQKARIKFETAPLPPHHVGSSEARVWFHAFTNGNTRLEVNAYWGGTLRASRNVAKGEPFAWRSLPVPLPHQAALDNLEVRFKTIDGGGAKVRASYVELPIPEGEVRVHAAYYEVHLGLE